ncbi:MAG: Rpn family recombination-promoting nuclease/putative transposase [Lachnospiraceae bacterium]|nr:Rpn family recombination-promoting nuclease/putative transposase [Lachnospiraceae bacterium]
MGKKDLWQSDYFDDKRRFADMINGVMFHGEQIIREEELEELDSQLVHHEKNEEAIKVIRDKVYRWKGQKISICILENQSYVDYRMVLRVMLEEAVGYLKQQKHSYRKWINARYKFTKNEFLSQMRKNEKFQPIITLILYLGKNEAWDGARSLYELLEMDERLQPFVTNYRLNLFDYHDYKDFSQFKTENRFIFELLLNSKDENKMNEIISVYMNGYLLDKESMRAIFGVLGINININKYKVKTEEGERFDMCKAWNDHKESGRQEGRQEAIKENLENLMKSMNLTLEKAMEALMIPEEDRVLYHID